MEHDDSNIVKSLNTSLATVFLRKDGIIELRFKSEDYVVDLEDQLEMEKAFIKLTNDGELPCHIIVIPGRHSSMTKEAREIEMFGSKAYRKTKSVAIVSANLAHRIIAKAYFTFKKQKASFPYNFFPTEKKALKWIKEFEKNKGKDH